MSHSCSSAALRSRLERGTRPTTLLCLDEAQFEVFGEQRMGEWVLVLGADGSRREVEVWVKGFPWARPLPPGQAHTTLDELWSYFATTRHLMIMDQKIAEPNSGSR
jgi:hypothetical protein